MNSIPFESWFAVAALALPLGLVGCAKVVDWLIGGQQR